MATRSAAQSSCRPFSPPFRPASGKKSSPRILFPLSNDRLRFNYFINCVSPRARSRGEKYFRESYYLIRAATRFIQNRWNRGETEIEQKFSAVKLARDYSRLGNRRPHVRVSRSRVSQYERDRKIMQQLPSERRGHLTTRLTSRSPLIYDKKRSLVTSSMAFTGY